MYSDEMMTWDERKHRYILTEACALAYNVDLKKELNASGAPAKNNLPAQILDRISRTVYNFIFLHGDRERKLCELEQEDEYYRQFLFEAMVEQLLYFMVNGDLNLTPQNAQDTSHGAAYAPEMQNILAQSGILYCGR